MSRSVLITHSSTPQCTDHALHILCVRVCARACCISSAFTPKSRAFCPKYPPLQFSLPQCTHCEMCGLLSCLPGQDLTRRDSRLAGCRWAWGATKGRPTAPLTGGPAHHASGHHPPRPVPSPSGRHDTPDGPQNIRSRMPRTVLRLHGRGLGAELSV